MAGQRPWWEKFYFQKHCTPLNRECTSSEETEQRPVSTEDCHAYTALIFFCRRGRYRHCWHHCQWYRVFKVSVFYSSDEIWKLGWAFERVELFLKVESAKKFKLFHDFHSKTHDFVPKAVFSCAKNESWKTFLKKSFSKKFFYKENFQGELIEKTLFPNAL